MDAGQGFVETLPIYTIMPNPVPQYVVGIKLSSELLEHLQSKGTTGHMTISFGQNGANIISLGNEQFSFRAPPEEHGVTDCYRQLDDEDGGTFTKVGLVKRKIFVTQKLREEDRKRVKTATETHEKERKSHKSVLIDDRGRQISKDGGKRKTLSSISKPPPMPIKRPRVEPTPRPQLSSLSSLAAKHTAPSHSSLLSSPKRVPLRTQIVQMLALEPLPHDQIESRCTNASKTAVASTLQQVAKTKDGLYHLKKEMYREVDTNWPGFAPDEKAKVLERKAIALQPEPEKKKEEEPADDILTTEPIALEAKATGARYPSPVPRTIGSTGKDAKGGAAAKEEKVVPARLAPPPLAAPKEKEMAPAREKEREKERERERERREKEKEKEKEREREREQRQREKERAKEKERLLSREKQERSPKDPSPSHLPSASSSASPSPSGSPTSQVVRGSSPNKAKEEVSSLRNGEVNKSAAKTSGRAGQPTREDSLSPPANLASKGPVSEEYKKRRTEWEKMYKEYCELHRKLKENAQFFQNLGAQLKRASTSEKAKIVHQISTDYQKRISRVRQWKLRFSFLHAEVKKEKAALIALQPS